ncbi:hypothetical protein KIW84_023218, partial [Lathyrus oleraceus]
IIFVTIVLNYFFNFHLYIQTWIIKEYQEELVVTTICCIFVVILSSFVALISEGISKAWILRPDKEFVSICFSVSIHLSVYLRFIFINYSYLNISLMIFHV